MHTNCPFCDTELATSEDTVLSDAWCNNEDCWFHGMPRYRTKYHTESNQLFSECFMIAEFYVEVSYFFKATIINKLEVCTKEPIFQLNKAIQFNLKNSQDTLDKLRVWVTFS